MSVSPTKNLGRPILVTLFVTMVSVACSGQNFSGGGNNSSPSEPAPAAIPTPTPIPSAPSDCTEAKLLSAQTSQSFVDQRAANSAIVVQLTFQPCPAQTSNLMLPLMFDLHADLDFSNPSTFVVGYDLAITGSAAQSGQMNFTVGSDLFGNTGSGWGHFESTSPVQVAPNVSTATLTLKLTTMKVLNVVNGNGAATANFTVPLYIKVGQSAPISSTITFSPK